MTSFFRCECNIPRGTQSRCNETLRVFITVEKNFFPPWYL